MLEPNLTQDLIDIEEPMDPASSIDNPLPKRIIPYTEILLPQRPIDRALKPLPRWTKSSTLNELPKRAMPYVDKLDPMRTADLKLTEEPVDIQSSSDRALPHLNSP
jgi:hypothetical protein